MPKILNWNRLFYFAFINLNRTTQLLKLYRNSISLCIGLSDICAKWHLSERHLRKLGLRERERVIERCGQMALLATYPDLT